jgi:NADH dehydrogenase FAD-containing subunit
MVKTIVVLGASYAGLAVAHRLLKHTRQQEKDLKVVLVSKVRQISKTADLLTRWVAGGAII